VQIYIWPSLFHCYSCSSKFRLVLPSWFYLSGADSPRWSRSKRAVKRFVCVCIALICIMLCFWCRWYALPCDHLRWIMSSLHLFFFHWQNVFLVCCEWHQTVTPQTMQRHEICCSSHTSGISVSVTDKHRHGNYNKMFLTEIIIIIIYRVGQ